MLRFVILLSLVSDLCAFDSVRQCLLLGDRCVVHCPRRMHAYHTRCDGQTMSQRTCDSPEVYVMGYTCGWSRCDCSGNLLLDEITGSCVNLIDCTALPRKLSKKQNPLRSKHRKAGRRKNRLSKRVKIEKEDMIQ